MTDTTTYTPNDVLGGINDLRSRFKATLAALVAPLLNGPTGGTLNPDGTGGPGPYYQVPDLDGAMHAVTSIQASAASILNALGVNTAVGGTDGVWPFLPIVDANGVLDIGRYIDLHYTSHDGSDFSVRMYVNAAGALEIAEPLQVDSDITSSGIVTAANRIRVISPSAAVIDFVDSAITTPDYKTVRWQWDGTTLQLQTINDAYTAVNGVPFSFSRDAIINSGARIGFGSISVSANSVGNSAVNFYSDAAMTTYSGSQIYNDCSAGNLLRINSGGGTTFVSGNFSEAGDNRFSLGLPATRWSQVFAVAGTIQTSDAREKTIRGPLNDAELRVARRCASLAKVYQWDAAIAAKTADKARLHISPIAQDVRDAFIAEGLDGRRYGVLCYDQWNEIAGVEAVEPTKEIHGQLDEKGQVISPYVPATPGRPAVAAIPEGDRWGIRPDQFNTFVSAGQEAEIAAQAARIAALEAKLSI